MTKALKHCCKTKKMIMLNGSLSISVHIIPDSKFQKYCPAMRNTWLESKHHKQSEA